MRTASLDVFNNTSVLVSGLGVTMEEVRPSWAADAVTAWAEPAGLLVILRRVLPARCSGWWCFLWWSGGLVVLTWGILVLGGGVHGQRLAAGVVAVLVAFAAFDRFTWSVWLSPAQPGVRIAGAEEYITEDAVSILQENYDAQEPGEYLTGPVRVAVLSADVQDVYMPATADVVI